jgi:hypothetical protein
MAPIIPKPTTTNNNGHGPYTCNHCHKVFEHKLEFNLHVAALHNSGKFFSSSNNRYEIFIYF